MKILLALIIGCLYSMAAIAEQAYVIDSFHITLRGGESKDHRVLSMLPTGEAVDVISRNATSGYAKVKTNKGLEGYVLQRYLTQKPIARKRLEKLQQELDSLKGAPDEMRKKILQANNQYAELQQKHTELSQAKHKLETEYAILQRVSANAVGAADERNKLRKKVADLIRHNEELQQEKQELENLNTQRWFLIGAGVVLGGILIGLLLPRLNINQRYNSWGPL